MMVRLPPASASIVIADMAAEAGVLAAIWITAVPSLILSVFPARYAKGDSASEPYASAVQTE